MTSVKDFSSYSDIDHVKLRSDMYIGSIKNTKEERWVYDINSEPNMKKKEVVYNPGLEQCCLELITNATDHVERCLSDSKVKNVSKIKIDFEDEFISVYNDGQGIPIDRHPDTGLYVPEMIFGSLRTSSNYDDTKKKTWGGKNGIGAKAANIFSSKFIIEVVCSGKKYYQEFTNSMKNKTEPKITSCKIDDYTKITYFPDFKSFDMTSFSSNDTKTMIEKRIYDSSAVSPKTVSVYLNSVKINIKDFKDYMDLYLKDSKKVCYLCDKWEVGFALNPYEESTQISFVNGICSEDGGTHVNHVLEPVINKITSELQSKTKNATIRKQDIKNNVIIFVKCYIHNPEFDSQLKRKLTSKISDFGSRCDIPDDIIKKITKLGVTANVVELAKAKEMKTAMKKMDGSKNVRLTDISKLEDANWAGTSKSMKCTLILTEGDSAKSMALNGIMAAGGRDVWGVFPLKGKFLNVRTATIEQLSTNKEVININRILGLKIGEKDIKKLRYGKVMFMCDSDVDGYHIKGLLLNYFTLNWPELVEQGLIESLLTPVIKVFKGKTTFKQFYNVDDYEHWKEGNDVDKYRIKYYKGLGTSDALEAKEYFSDLKNNRLYYKYNKTDDDNSMVLAFDKDYSDKRKDWILDALRQKNKVDYTKKEVPVKYFCDNELVKFSIYDNERSIPNVIDGLKPSQRKILFGCLKKKLFQGKDGSGEIKVAQLSGYISEHSAYHHGENSLQETIINMAQDFVGANNLNLLHPQGSFGTRLENGKDAASPRYIFTYLKDYVKILFNEYDNKLLTYLDDDGTKIEPMFYVPIIPMLLVNGSTGIGTGWSTNIPCFNPKDIIECIESMLSGSEPKEIMPWYKGFKGSVVKTETGWKTIGAYRIIDQYTLEITEIPIGVSKQKYKEDLLEMLEQDKLYSVDLKEKNGSDEICFRVKLRDEIDEGSIKSMFNLEKSINGNNMTAFEPSLVNDQYVNTIRKYTSPIEILKTFYNVRLNFYDKRKILIEETLSTDIEIISERLRFVKMVVSNELVIFKKPDSEVDALLTKHKFINKTELLGMSIRKFTLDEIKKLEKNLEDLVCELKCIKGKTKEDLWREDLSKLKNCL